MNKREINITALLISTMLGFIAGLLFAPSTRDNVGRVLSYKMKGYVSRLQELIQALSRTRNVVSSDAKTAGREVIDETINSARQLLKDANELTSQLEK